MALSYPTAPPWHPQLYFVDANLHPIGCIRIVDMLRVLLNEGGA